MPRGDHLSTLHFSQDIKHSYKTPCCVGFDWKCTLLMFMCAPIHSYMSWFNSGCYAFCLKQVVYWEDDTKPETMGKVRVPWNQTSVTVSGLSGNTQYFLTVSAFNTAGTGPFLPAINVTTKKPRKFKSLDDLLSKCLISWLDNKTSDWYLINVLD